MADNSNYEAARKDFDKAVHQAQMALDATSSPAMRYLILALATYSRMNAEVTLSVHDQLDDISRNINNITARLDGKQGPFSLKMR
jgi:hypothetical protein